MIKYETFTRRTNDPKLKWIEQELKKAEIKHRRKGHSFHAPILQVDKNKIKQAWEILAPVDDIPDDDPRFNEATEPICPHCKGKGVRTPRKYAYNCQWCKGKGYKTP